MLDNLDGTFKLGYTPQVAGPQQLSVTINGTPINGSPYTVTINDRAARITHARTSISITSIAATGGAQFSNSGDPVNDSFAVNSLDGAGSPTGNRHGQRRRLQHLSGQRQRRKLRHHLPNLRQLQPDGNVFWRHPVPQQPVQPDGLASRRATTRTGRCPIVSAGGLTVYLIDTDATARRIPDAATFNALFRDQLGDLGMIATGADVTPDGPPLS